MNGEKKVGWKNDRRWRKGKKCSDGSSSSALSVDFCSAETKSYCRVSVCGEKTSEPYSSPPCSFVEDIPGNNSFAYINTTVISSASRAHLTLHPTKGLCVSCLCEQGG